MVAAKTGESYRVDFMSPRFYTLFLCAWATAVFPQSQTIESRYTDLTEKACRTLELTEDGVGYRGLCGGAGGYQLELLEGDLRQSLNVIAPNGKKFELNLWSVGSGGFSALGDKAEWRVRGGAPFALIVRQNVNEDPDQPEKRTSYLIVVKLSISAACITDIVRPAADQNVRARKLADSSPARPCMSP